MLQFLKKLLRYSERLDTLSTSELNARVSEELGYRIVDRMPQYYFVVAVQTPEIRKHVIAILDELSARYYVVNEDSDWQFIFHSNPEKPKKPKTHPITIVETGGNIERAKILAERFEQEERRQEVCFYNWCVFIFSGDKLPSETDLGMSYDERSDKDGIGSRIWRVEMITKPNLYLLWRYPASITLPEKYQRYVLKEKTPSNH